MKLKIIYPYTNLDFPSRKANMLQTISTCLALARTGRAEVHFIFRNPKKWSARKILGYFGLESSAEMHIHSITVPYINQPVFRNLSNMVFKIALYLTMMKLARGATNALVYARDINVVNMIQRVSKLVNIKVVYEAHSIQSWFFKNLHAWHGSGASMPVWKQKIFSSRENRVLNGADIITTVTGKLREVLIDDFGIDPAKVHVVPDAARVDGAPAYKGEGKNGRRVVGYTGQLNIVRGVDMLVEAMALLDPDTELLIVGGDSDSNLNRLSALAEKTGVKDRISFTGYVEPRVVREAMKDMDVLVMPHLNHVHTANFASPLKMFEYMSLKRPIVATDLPSTREILKHGENAELVKPDDTEALAAGIRNVLENKKLGEKLAQNAYRDVAEKYTYKKRAEMILTVINGTAQEN